MSFTLIMAVTAAVAATMGYMAARRKSDDGPEDERDSKDDPPDEKEGAGKEKAAPKSKPEAKGKGDPRGKGDKAKAEADPKAAFAGLPVSLGDVVSDHVDERWLAGALLAREDGRLFAALFLAPEGKQHSAVAAFAPPKRSIFWMEPTELTSPDEPPTTIELAGVAMKRKGRIPVTIERFGQGAPPVAEEAIWAAYEGGGRDVAVVLTSQGRVYAWAGRRLEEEEYDVLGEG